MSARHTPGAADIDVDVVVVGAGGCGLAAALAAADAGATVAVLEKMDHPGGNTALSTGSVPAAGSRYQAAAGILDDPDRMVADLLRQSGRHEAEDTLRLLADQSADLVEWLVEEHSVDLQLITDYRHVGHSVERLHAPPDRRGRTLMRDLLAAAAKADVDVAVGNPVTGLLFGDDGAVAGVRVAGPRCGSYQLRSHAVVLAANGFGANRQLLERWIPSMANIQYFGAEGASGEALSWCVDNGAELRNIGAYQGYAAVAYPHGSIVSWTTVEKGGILLAADGTRMGDELLGYSGFAEHVAQHGTESWVVFDARIRDYVRSHEPEFDELCAIGGVIELSDPDAVATHIGADREAVTSSLAQYAASATGDQTDQFGRTSFAMAPLQPPLCVVRSVPGLFHTQGGAAVDEQARVMRGDGTPIPGLYAGGGVTAGLSGQSGAAGYSSGNGLLSALGMGRIAGASAVRRSRNDLDASRRPGTSVTRARDPMQLSN